LVSTCCPATATFLVNGRQVYTDNTRAPEQGYVGLAASGYAANYEAVFDNFSISGTDAHFICTFPMCMQARSVPSTRALPEQVRPRPDLPGGPALVIDSRRT